MSSSPKKLAVVGTPIAHSKSPLMFELFAAQTGADLSYVKIDPEGGDFEKSAREFFDSGGLGLNVTVPYKSHAIEFADEVSNGARMAGAANTLKAQPNGAISACNTDGPGLVRDLRERQGARLEGAKIALVGAGGAAAGVVSSLARAKPVRLEIFNRTSARAQKLAERFAAVADEENVELGSGALNDMPKSAPFDLVINATSAGVAAKKLDLPSGALVGSAFCYDMNYAAAARDFLDAAREAGVEKLSDGLGMLVEQACFSYAYWFENMPDGGAVYEKLAAGLGE